MFIVPSALLRWRATTPSWQGCGQQRATSCGFVLPGFPTRSATVAVMASLRDKQKKSEALPTGPIEE